MRGRNRTSEASAEVNFVAYSSFKDCRAALVVCRCVRIEMSGLLRVRSAELYVCNRRRKTLYAMSLLDANSSSN